MVGVVAGGRGWPRRVFAADPRYPDWPCAQAKVPEVSLAAVWAGPPHRRRRRQVEGRRQGERDWCRGWPHGAPRSTKPRRRSRSFSPVRRQKRPTNGKLLFAGLFDTLNAQRASVMAGPRAGDPQTARGGRQGSEPTRWRCRPCRMHPPAIRPRSTNSAISWSGKRGFSRIATASSNSSARCPTAIDQRLFALGRAIQQEME